MNNDPETLISLARSGDLGAFEGLVRQYQGMATSYAYSLVGDFHLAQDVAQEAFVNAYAEMGQLRASEAFVSWFRRIVFKHCDRITRTKRVAVVPLDETRWASLEDDTSARDDAIRRAVEGLPGHERAVVALFYFGRYPEKQVAIILSLPLSTVKNRLRAARKRLKSYITPEELSMADTVDERFSEQVVERIVRVQQTVPFLWVSDIEASLRFYLDALGFEMIRRWDKGGRLRWCWLQHGGAALMLQVDHDHKSLDHRGIGVQLYFICEDADIVYRQASARGVDASEPDVGNGMLYTNVVDPDGYALTFQSPTTDQSNHGEAE